MIKIKTLIEVLLCAFIVRRLALPASVGDALSVLALAGLYGFQIYLDNKKVKDPSDEIRTRLKDLEDKAVKFEGKFAGMQISGRR